MTQPNERIPSKTSTAAGWIKWHAWNELAMRPMASWACDAVRVAPGQRVLDVGAGTGIPALTLAARAHPGGSVVAVDHTASMLDAARTNAETARLENITFREMDAQKLDFADGSFDAVTSTLTLMFCADPSRVVSEMKRVLKPGGRFAFAVWDEPAKNPFFTTTLQTVAQRLRLPAPDPSAPGPFRLAKEGELSTVLRAGGFPEAELASLAFQITFESVDQHWEIFSDMMPALKTAANTLPAHEVAQLRGAIREALTPHLQGSRVLLTATLLTASGRRTTDLTDTDFARTNRT
jgi:SAM-dependent methyltransferase